MLAIGFELAASALIFCHNHPSGFLAPSKADKLFTERMMYIAEKTMKFKVLDHIIISPYNRYYSFVGNNLISCHGNLKYYQKSKEEIAEATYLQGLGRKAA